MFWSERAGLLRPKRFWLWLGWLLIAMIPLLAATVFLTHGATMMAAIYAALLGPMSLSYGMRSTDGAKADAGSLEVNGDAVMFAGRVLLERKDLRQAFVVPQLGRALVRLERHGRLQRPVFVQVADREEADAFVRALGLDAERTAAEMRIASTMLGWSVGRQLLLVLAPFALFVPPLVFFAKNATIALSLSFVYVLYTFVIAFAPTTVQIGTDGIVTRWLGRTRFIGHAEIARVTAYDEVRGTKRQRGVRLDLKSGEVVRLPTGQREIALTEAAQLERRIDEARDAYARGATAGSTDVLARGDRSIADWIRHLRGVGAGAVNLRAPAIPKDVLLRVVEDSKAAPLDRASAAVAAIASGDDDVKRRVRVAAEATVSPKLRVALERIATNAEQDEEELLASLESLESLNERREVS